MPRQTYPPKTSVWEDPAVTASYPVTIRLSALDYAELENQLKYANLRSVDILVMRLASDLAMALRIRRETHDDAELIRLPLTLRKEPAPPRSPFAQGPIRPSPLTIRKLFPQCVAVDEMGNLFDKNGRVICPDPDSIHFDTAPVFSKRSSLAKCAWFRIMPDDRRKWNAGYWPVEELGEDPEPEKDRRKRKAISPPSPTTTAPDGTQTERG